MPVIQLRSIPDTPFVRDFACSRATGTSVPVWGRDVRLAVHFTHAEALSWVEARCADRRMDNASYEYVIVSDEEYTAMLLASGGV